MLISLGQHEIKDILDTLGEASVTCEFCSTQYYCNQERLTFLLSHFEEN
jgi:redox-regulated HSP33 family molecular chaperone